MSGWEARRLLGVAEVILGRQRSPQHDVGPHMVPYLRAANVQPGRIDLTDVKSMNFTPREQRTFAVLDGDVLVTEGSGSIASVGASAKWEGPTDGALCFQNTLLRLRARPGTDPRWLAWWAQYAFASGLFAAVAGGANIYHLSADRVRSLSVALPPLDEQRRIADFLDTETAQLADLERLRAAQASLVVERESAGISVTLEDSQRRHIKLGHLARLQSGVTVGGTRSSGSLVSRPYLRVANVKEDRLELDDVTEIEVTRQEAARSSLRPRDVLMTEGGDLDKLGRGTLWNGEIDHCLHQNHGFAIRCSPHLLPEFLAYYTRTSAARAYFAATGVKTTNLASTNSTKVLELQLPSMSIDEQRARVSAVESLVSVARATRVAISRQSTAIRERRDALITAAVTGEFDVSTSRPAHR